MKLQKIDGGYMFNNDPKFEELSKGVKNGRGDIVYYVAMIDINPIDGTPKVFYKTFVKGQAGQCFSHYFDKTILYSDEKEAKAAAESSTYNTVVQYKFINREEK